MRLNISKRIPIAILGFFTLIFYLIECKLLTTATLFQQVFDSVPDEILLYNSSCHYTIHSGMEYGYGAPFWWISKLIISVLPNNFSFQQTKISRAEINYFLVEIMSDNQ